MLNANIKTIIITKLVQAAWLGLLTFVTTFLIAGTTFYVFASFTEPEAGPGSSSQDFTENILGANNADNAFSSNLVTASSTGSIIERLQDLKEKYSMNYDKMRYQAYDDWNCNGSAGTGNNDVSNAACLATDPEFTGEEAVWATSSDATPGSEKAASGPGRPRRTHRAVLVRLLRLLRRAG